MSDLHYTAQRLAWLTHKRYRLSRWPDQTAKQQLKAQGQAQIAQKSNERNARKSSEKHWWIQTWKLSHDAPKNLAKGEQKVHRKANQEHPVGTNYASRHSESETSIRRNNQEHHTQSKPGTPPFHPIDYNGDPPARKTGDEATWLYSSA